LKRGRPGKLVSEKPILKKQGVDANLADQARKVEIGVGNATGTILVPRVGKNGNRNPTS